MYARRYALIGAGIGAGLPFFASFIEARLRYGGDLLAAQAGSPLLWIIDTTPFVVGFLAVLVGRHQDRIIAVERSRTEGFLQTASDLSAASHALLTSVQAFSAMTAQTAASVKETTHTMSGLSHTAMQAALTAETVIGLAQQSSKSSEDGLGAVELTVAGMQKVAEEVRGLAERIVGLNGRMRDIFAITGVVKEIADRSEQLAAFAAAEAAKTVPSTEGVAQMASELREHATDARNAATQVQSILLEVHKAMKATLAAAESGSQRAESGAAVAAGTGATIRKLATTIRDSSEAAREIAVVAQQQDRGIDEVLKAMNEVFQAVEEGVVATGQVAEEAKSLSELADSLKRSVNR